MGEEAPDVLEQSLNVVNFDEAEVKNPDPPRGSEVKRRLMNL